MLFKVTVLLTLFLQCIGGIERVTIVVSESIIDDLISDDECTFTTQVVGNTSILCCIYGSYSCSSLYNALANITSNVLINITTDVVLPSKIPLVDLANITIMGHNNPTVNCNNSGGLLFTSCSNTVIEGINWEHCGSRNLIDDNVYPVLQLFNSSNIKINNCSFKYSLGQTIKLSRISGDISINSCNFLYNTKYKGHGSAIFYSLNIFLLNFTITGCKFSYNEGAKSVVYFGEPFAGLLYLQNSEFHHNKGVPIYLSNQDLHINGNITIHNNVAENGGGIFISNHSNVIIHKNATVSFTNNTAESNGGAIFLTNHSSIFVKDYTSINLYHGEAVQFYFIRIKFYNNKARYGGAIYANKSRVNFGDCAVVMITDNSAEQQGGSMYSIYSVIAFGGHSVLIFISNNAQYGGGALYIFSYSTLKLEGNSTIIISNNSANFYGGAILIEGNSTSTFGGNSVVTFDNNSADYYGGGMHISDNTNVTFQGNSVVIFSNSNADYGGAVSIYMHSTVTFEENFTLTFSTNSAHYGGAVFIYVNSAVRFKENSVITLNSNTAYYGGAVIVNGNSALIFEGNCTATFNDNSADVGGGAVYIFHYSTVTFEESSAVIFNNNRADYGGAVTLYNSIAMFGKTSIVTFNNNSAVVNGGALFIDNYSVVTFEGHSMVTCHNNSANNHGGGLAIHDNSTVTFEGNSRARFSNNIVNVNGGALSIDDYSTVTFEGISTVVFYNNIADVNGGVVFTDDYSTITFAGNSTVTMNNNRADFGGAVFSDDSSTVKFERHCTVTFNNNNADKDSGAFYIDGYSTMRSEGDSTIIFNNNSADKDSGALYIDGHSAITFAGNSTVAFNNNNADYGGAVNIDYSTVKFEGTCTVTFNKNSADKDGGAMAIYDKSTVTFQENSIVIFDSNSADNGGGAMDIDDYSVVNFEENSIVKFHNNSADKDGGAVVIYDKATTKFEGNSTVTFNNNSAGVDGGAVFIDDHSTVTFEGNTKVKFIKNSGNVGGTIFIESSQIVIKGNSCIQFINNIALQDGGAIYLSSNSKITVSNNSNITFYGNTANDYGGAIYALLKESSMYFNSSNMNFKDNNAGIIHKPVYLNVPKSCNSSCVSHSVYIANKTIVFTTSSKLILYNPSKCINGNGTNCDTYYLQNIMLGQKITFDACVVDYFDQPIGDAKEFLITALNHQDYNISGSKYISVLCNYTTQGISVIGNLHSNTSYNYSLTISMHVARISELNISVNLTIELSQCHPGFWYSSDSQKCECYDTENIISCSGSSSTIKRGYWFGSVTGIYTVTSCPNDYCNFTCCEIANGIYHLSPVRLNQCGSHRSGVGCGNCEKGYTLSFDSTECVNIDECTIAQTVLVTTLSFLYWIIIVVAVFAMMYFRITIGSLYAIIYYYSVVDILLGRVLFISNGLHTTVNIMSSLAKLTPQFLGKLCLIRNMSGIDQQFMHYMHPTAVSLILIVISMLARRSHGFSSFVSRGIIHFICFLLLLSYTSVTSTSLLLMRSLKFMKIDRLYTYLSPDIEYFHGRHLAYAMVAMTFTIVIVIGLPLLLLLEPFFNSKINFIKIKPLLDQFQCCYKDKYRWFASYYMICRIVIIVLVILKISDDFTTQYLLSLTCALMAFIHLSVRPYVNTFHNIFDGAILQFIVILSILPIIEFINYYNKVFVLVIVYLLIILPLASFITIKLWVNRNKIQSAFKDCCKKCLHKLYNAVPTDDVEELVDVNEAHVAVDNNNINTRINTPYAVVKM